VSAHATHRLWAVVETDQPLLEGVAGLIQTGQDPITIEWSNPLAYTSIDVHRDGVLIATLAGNATSFSEPASPGSLHLFFVQGHVGASAAVPRTVRTSTPAFGDDYSLDIDAGSGLDGEEARVAVRVSNAESVHGWSFGVCHDATLVTGVDVELGTAWGGAISTPSPAFWNVLIEEGELATGVVIAFNAVNLPSGTDRHIHDLVYMQEQPGAELVTPLRFCNTVGFPVVSNVVVVAGASVVPFLDHGSVAFGSIGFTRGDCNGDGSVDVADPIATLAHLFGGVPSLCPEACEVNGDSALDMADPIAALGYLFGSAPSPPLPLPFPDCGADPDPAGSLGCAAAPGCP
jgi:hypothetical protein